MAASSHVGRGGRKWIVGAYRTPPSLAKKIFAKSLLLTFVHLLLCPRRIPAAVAQPEVKKAFERDASLAKPMTPPEFSAFLRSEVEKWTPVIKTFAASK